MRGAVPLPRRALWLALGWCFIAAVWYLELTGSPPQPAIHLSDKFWHALTYFLLTAWFVQLYRGAAPQARVAVALAAMGMLLEVLQWVGGTRHFELLDELANSSGVLLAWLLARTGFAGWLEALDRRLPGA